MYNDIEKAIATLPAPTVFDSREFDDLLAENIDALKVFLGDEYIPLESDPFMKKLRVLTLRQLHNVVDKNETIKQLLVTTATGSNLDNLGAAIGVFRDAGEYPVATYEFILSTKLDYDVVIPAKTLFSNSDDTKKAELIEDVVIPAGEIKAVEKVQLLEYVKTSDEKVENIITDLPFVVEVKQLESFSGGDEAEDDDRYRVRIIASYSRYSTAGAEDAYKYFAFSADSRIDDVVVLEGDVLEVYIYIASFSGVDDEMIKKVEEATTSKYRRPLGDRVFVKPAVEKKLNIKAEIEVFELLKAGEIEQKIRDNFKDSFYIGQDFIRSDFDRKCHVDGVYRVNSSFSDVIVKDNEIIKIESLKLIFKEVQR